MFGNSGGAFFCINASLIIDLLYIPCTKALATIMSVQLLLFNLKFAVSKRCYALLKSSCIVITNLSIDGLVTLFPLLISLAVL